MATMYSAMVRALLKKANENRRLADPDVKEEKETQFSSHSSSEMKAKAERSADPKLTVTLEYKRYVKNRKLLPA